MQALIETLIIPIIKFELDDDCKTHILYLLRNFKITTDGTGIATPSSLINYLLMMLRVQALREFNKVQSQYSGATNNHLKIIQKGLLEYLFPIDALSNE